jgi:hypothetical protein
MFFGNVIGRGFERPAARRTNDDTVVDAFRTHNDSGDPRCGVFVGFPNDATTVFTFSDGTAFVPRRRRVFDSDIVGEMSVPHGLLNPEQREAITQAAADIS